VKKSEIRPDLAPEITVENSVGTLSVHPITGEERAKCQTTTYIFRFKGEMITSITQWRFEDGFEMEKVSSHYTDGEYIRRTQDELKDRTREEFMRHWEKGYDAAMGNCKR